MEPFILSPVPYAQLLEDLRAIIRHETAQQQASAFPAEPNAGADLLTVQEAAELLDVCPQTIHEWKRRGLLTYHKMGRQLTLIDFKTTSSPDLGHFLTTIEKYDYDRQAALYLDVLGATRFLIIGVQKKAPHNVWRVELTGTPGLIEQGRKKYARLLKAFWQQGRPVVSAVLGPPTQARTHDFQPSID
ncbi:hypothetical protein GCM10022409_06080 [Hymenobacter glaciei]|uniref:Helix-turn-helix domain-containing protein n=1 Tax=Hymenobacter glaciei TaxID=877209 RepID=A0ABP7TDW6_9BACT